MQYLQLLIVLFVLGCTTPDSQTQSSTSYFYVHYDYLIPDILYLDTSFFELKNEHLGMQYHLKHQYKESKTNNQYSFTKKEGKNAVHRYIGKTEKTDSLYFVAKKILRTSNFECEVYKFAQDPGSKDGCINYFWVPSIGIILHRSATWGNYSKLQTNDFELNQKINTITEIIYQKNNFYRGCRGSNEIIDDIPDGSGSIRLIHPFYFKPMRSIYHV
ncbi:hypothetical protein PEPS_15020 [Persicobacter psychrovividus]|uniref:Lipoprotein n=1 Tax=Persicobacter psychrovividus TaxID=387638 RepID=A0ABM7VE48_9BACT|nr:hypothetical protein PEPS_15020 [Persicobacter psychrovividus]